MSSLGAFKFQDTIAILDREHYGKHDERKRAWEALTTESRLPLPIPYSYIEYRFTIVTIRAKTRANTTDRAESLSKENEKDTGENGAKSEYSNQIHSGGVPR